MKNAPSLSSPSIILLSFFGIGMIPKIQGTICSLVMVPILYILSKYSISFIVITPFILVLIIISSFLTEMIQNKYKIHDPKWIVIDEVIGMLICFLFIRSSNILNIFIMFGIFRFFDIIKIWPANYFDSLKHGVFVIIDDIVSAIYSGITYIALSYLNFLPL